MAMATLQARTLADRLGKRAVDDIGRVELLFDEARAEIQVDGLLLIGHDAVIDRDDADLRPRQPVERHRGRNVHELAPRLGIALDVTLRPRPRRDQTPDEVLQLRTLVPDGDRRSHLKADAGRDAFRRDDAAGVEHTLL